ncbi:MAG: hypothetical protein H7255_21500, partial [Ramlibacter sp.]|nr:hypothetical protein [Ramlibacter sp.]
MGDMRVGLSLLQAFMPAAPEFKLPHKTAEESSQPEDPVLGALEWQLHQVAQRRQIEQVGFDVQEVASELRGRMTGLVLNLWSPSTGLAACLAALQPQELEDLLTASCADGGSAIADIELDADTVEVLKPALIHCRDDIARLSVRMPAEGSDPDFQGIQDAMGLPRIHFVSADSPARGPLLELLRKVASRSEPDETGIDVEQAATDLQGRIAKSRLDLTSLSPQLEHCLGAFEPEDADALLEVGITRVEMDAGFFRVAEPALMRNAAHLESVTVRVPARCSEPDVSGLLGQNSPLRINVLRDEGDVDLADESVAQAALQAPVAVRVRADEELRGDLLYVLGKVAAGDPARFNQGEIHAVAQAVMDCASQGVASGKFGWDFHGKLPAACVPWLQARGSELFTALQNAAERADTGTDWVDLHDDFVIDPDLVARLSALAPISKLIVSAPANGVFISLGKPDDGALLKELVIRNADDKKLMIT